MTGLLKRYSLLIFLAISTVAVSCKKEKSNDNSINIFSIEDDKALGQQVADEIASDPAHYPILDPVQYASAYNHLGDIVNAVLSSDDLNHRDDFDWEFHIIHDDSVLNAFAAPGGKIYVYTGIIKYLDSEDQLAGVLGHEIAHADRRHVTDQLTKIYGVDFLLGLVIGNDSSLIGNVAESLASLKFSRTAEAEADEYSVIYLYDTDYDARGAARFFEKLIAQGQTGGTPEFLSTHPDPGNRVEAIKAKWQELGAKEGAEYPERYAEFKNSLP